MMESMVEVPPDDGGSINNLSLNAAWNGTSPNATNNSNILFIAVEYVSKEHDFKLESEPSLSPQQRYTEFEQHVSPLDPNMSSVARYSPVYTSEPSTYVNPVVVTQLVADPTSVPSVEMPPTSTVGDTVASPELQHVSNQYLQMVEEENHSNVNGDGVNELRMVRDVEQGVDILITDQSTGISYLVERCLANDSQLLDPDSLLGSDLLSLDESTQLSEIIIGEDGMCDQEVDEKIEMKGGERRSQRQISNCVPETEEELLSCVQQICDRPILSRARASLPESHLVIIKNQLGGNSIFAKKFIPKRTQFGPIEGVIVPDDGIKQEDDGVVLTIENSGQFQKLDVSDENSSNWMGFVQLAQCHSEQNLVLTQQDNYLYYTTIKHIHPKQELLVGYGINYAQRRNLLILEPLIEEEDLWPCYECSEQFLSSVELQKHLDQHDLDSQTPNSANKKRKRKNPTPQSIRNEALQCTVCLEIFTSQKFSNLRQHLVEHGLDPMEQLQNRFIIAKSYNCDECDAIYVKEDELNCHMEKHQQLDNVAVSFEPKETERQKVAECKCPVCHKSFASGERVQKHMLVHGAEELKPLKCDKCNKRFLNSSALTCHLKTHLVGRKIFECPICKESFHHVLQLKLHVPKHSINGRYTCPHCHKLFEKYSIIRKHIRAFHCERKHRCTDCDKLFPTLDKLRTHLVKHSDHREFLCADCGKQFKRKDKLREHCKRMHSEERENAIPRDKTEVSTPTKKFTPKVHPSDYQRFIYKCHTCLLGFKRRGMLVNHLAKRHPDISPDSVPELNLPILKATKDYYCNYCDKVYKSSSKRKAHILKIHPGASLPLSNRRLDSAKSDLPNPTFSQTVGSVTTRPQACQWCHKQYASKAKLLQHQRKKHNEMLHDKKDDIKSSEEDLLTQQDSHYYQLVMDDSHFGQQDIAGDSRLYKLLTTGNNLVPPR